MENNMKNNGVCMFNRVIFRITVIITTMIQPHFNKKYVKEGGGDKCHAKPGSLILVSSNTSLPSGNLQRNTIQENLYCHGYQ